jgi:Pvc16 N-terminal domain
MSDYNVLADVGQALIDVLWEEISNDPPLHSIINDVNLISLESPAENNDAGGDSALLSVYLYRITEDAFMKNSGPVEGNGGRMRKPPMALDLYYLITPMLKTPRDQQIVLGKVMRVLYDRPTLDPSGSAGGPTLRVIFNAVPLNELSWIWQALETPYRLSANYVVRVTMLDSTDEAYRARVLSEESIFDRNTQLVSAGR